MDQPVISIPTPLKDPAPGAEVRPKRLQAWLDELPLTNSAEAARQTYQALYTQNRLSLDENNRLELMELFRGAVAVLCETLQGGFSNTPLPLTDRQRQQANMVHRLETEMAYGYKVVLRDMLARGIAPAKSRTIPLVVCRAVVHLGRVLLTHYQIYEPYPAGIWRELHQLYQYADANRFADQRLEAGALAYGDGHSVRDAYQRVLLLGICNPYSLQQGECRRVHTFLSLRSPKVRLSRDLEVPDPTGRFLVSLTADAPPIPFPKVPEITGSGKLRVLDVFEHVKELHVLLKRLEQGESPRQLGLCDDDCIDTAYADLLRRMGRLWGLSIRRQSNRSPKDGEVSVCVGINAGHFFVSGHRPFTPPLIPEDEIPVADAYIDMAVLAGENGDGEGAQQIEEAPAPFELETWQARDEYQVYQWQTKDESAGGLALERKGDFAVRMRVGDLLAIRHQGLDVWRVGVVRWLRSPESDALELGVQLLAPSVRAVAVRRVPSAMDKRPRYMQALLLPANKALQHPATVIVPRGLYLAGRELWLADDGAEPVRVRLLQLVDRTGTYEQIVFTTLDDG